MDTLMTHGSGPATDAYEPKDVAMQEVRTVDTW